MKHIDHATHSVDHGIHMIYVLLTTAARSAAPFPRATMEEKSCAMAHAHGGWLKATAAADTTGFGRAQAHNWLATQLLRGPGLLATILSLGRISGNF